MRLIQEFAALLTGILSVWVDSTEMGLVAIVIAIISRPNMVVPVVTEVEDD